MELVRQRPDEAGIGLVIAILVLLVVSALGVAAINHSNAESVLGARQRRTMTTFFASDAGIQMVMEKINRTVADVTPVNQTLGDGTNIRTGTRTDTTPQNVRQGGAVNSPPDGYMINVGSGGFSTLPYYAEITATGPDNSVVELEAKLGRLEMN